MTRLAIATSVLALFAALPAAAEMEISAYTGYQTAPHSRVKGDYPGTGAAYNALIGWDGKSFAMPPYYGLRGTWWTSENLGFALEFTHTKVYAPAAERNAIGFDRLEFTDGHNIITANAMYRWPNKWGAATPYAGAGLGIALPHVDVTSSNGYRTFGYQMTGMAGKVMAGVSYELSDRYSIFGEYQFTYSSNEADLEGGGSLNTDIITNAINVGLSLKF